MYESKHEALLMVECLRGNNIKMNKQKNTSL